MRAIIAKGAAMQYNSRSGSLFIHINLSKQFSHEVQNIIVLTRLNIS